MLQLEGECYNYVYLLIDFIIRNEAIRERVGDQSVAANLVEDGSACKTSGARRRDCRTLGKKTNN